MKKVNHTKLSLEKFTVTKLTNLSSIYGGTDGTDEGGLPTDTDPTKDGTLVPTQFPTITQG